MNEEPAGPGEDAPRKNRYLPNTPEEQRAFQWWLHQFGGRAMVVAAHLARLEKKHQVSHPDGGGA